MKIGVVGTIWLNTPPKGYGGTEEVVYNLVNGLVDRGHDVSLFAPGTAKTKAKLISTVPKPLRDSGIDWTDSIATTLHIATAFERAKEFDILHIQLNRSQDYMALPLAMRSRIPVLFTLHFQLPVYDGKRINRKLMLEKYKDLPFVSISDSQRKGMKLNYIATVYNGLRIEEYPFYDKPGTYVVWLGRVHPDKGTKDAILAAKKANKKLVVMGVVDYDNPVIVAYYEHEIKPLLAGGDVVWVGEVSNKEKMSILGKASVFLNPIKWEEPFGLVMTESQAVGTPVISYKRGAAPELIQNGKTGFLVEDVSGMVKKISEIEQIDRHACRRNVEDHFTVATMVDGYLAAYEKTIRNWGAYRRAFGYN